MWWTEEAVAETVTSAYIHSHLRAHEQDILKRPLYFGGDLTDENYLDWILSRARRFFLILVAVGVPDQIFGCVDDSFDDEDLPIAADRIEDLRLSFEPDKALDKRFYKTQFKFLSRTLEEKEHIRYAEEETVPITPLGIKSVISFNKDGVDTIKLPTDPSRIFVRRRINLDSRTTEETILAEIAEMAKFSHEHVASVFASCLQGNTVTILSLPAPEWTLKGFLMDTPKSFESLSKTKRRKTLLEWPHCLANALAWLHNNGGHHGAIRPSSIIIDQHYSISLGPLEGDGVLTSTTSSEDIEAYQYAPPERWKRAVTVQSTGSGKVALPSGGRSARKPTSDPLDPADPSTRKRSGSSSGIPPMDGINSYAFLPASKSETYTRFRLSTAINPDSAVVVPPPRRRLKIAENSSNGTRSTTRATNDRGLITRTPSVLSQTSSEERRRSQRPRGLFAAAPEAKTAVVQIWKSNLHNSFAADVFSLGAVIMDILTVLCKRTFSSFSRHRSAKNRNAGRGGGLADASFHANLGQVMSWAEQISNEAEKKAKKDESGCLTAVGAVLQVVVQCLERNPEARLKSSVLEQRLGSHIKKFADIDPLHCVAQMPDKTPTMQPHQRALEAPSPLLSPIHLASDRSSSRSRQATIIEEEPATRPSTVYSPSTTTTSRAEPQYPPSLPSLNFDVDGRSDTIVGGQDDSRDPSIHHRARRPRNADRLRGVDSSTEQNTWKPEVSTPKDERWDYIHSNESGVDPRLTLSTNGSERGGVFTYINYSTSPSEDGEEPTTYQFSLPPSRPPNRKLPDPPPPTSSRAHPPNSKKGSASHQQHRYNMKSPPPEPSREEIEMLQQLSHAAIGGHPPRMSSLSNTQSDTNEEEEEAQYREMARAGRRAPTPAALKSKGDRRERVYRTRS